MIRKILQVVAFLLVLYGLVVGAIFVAMHQPAEKFARVMSHVPWPAMAVLPFEPLWNISRKGDLQVGDTAPDFALESPDHKSQFQLSSMRGKKPVVLVFGSYT